MLIMKKFFSVILILILVITSTSVYSEEVKTKEIAFADAGWDSVKFHNAVAGLIAEQIFGYK